MMINLKNNRLTTALLAGTALMLLASCNGNNNGGGTPPPGGTSGGGSTGGGSSGGGTSGSGTPPVVDPDPLPSETLPSETLPVDWHHPPGQLVPGSSSIKTDFGFVMTDDSGVIVEPAPGIRFPINEGPAFPNSQVLGNGGSGFPGIGLPAAGGGQNSVANYSYPWRDNFCEYRANVSAACPAQKGHYGQDIRPGTCDNGKYLAVAPEEIRIRTIGSNHGVLAFGMESGLLYSFLHLDRPLAINPHTGMPIKLGDILNEGEAIGRISSRTDPVAACGSASQYCTTLHLHFEIWSGAVGTALGSWNKGTQALPPYTSLIASYERLLDEQPDGEDWVNAQPLVDSNLCKPPSLR